jgi:hypothetical protein
VEREFKDFDMAPGPIMMTFPPSPPKVYAAIASVMREIGRIGISKDRKNDQQGYKFRGIDDVYNAMSGLLANAGLCVLPRVMSRQVTERTTKSGGVLFYVVLDMQFDLVCAEDGSRHTIAVVGEAMDSGDKATNKAMSAAFKYACMEVFCIPTEGTPDADQTTHEVAAADVPEDCWTALTDASKLGEKELRKVWKEQISEGTREVITSAHAERWGTIKAIAAGIDNQKKVAA